MAASTRLLAPAQGSAWVPRRPGEPRAIDAGTFALATLPTSPFVSLRKSCERAYRSAGAAACGHDAGDGVISRGFYPDGGGWAQVRRSSGLAVQGRNRSSAFPVSGFPPLRPHSSR